MILCPLHSIAIRSSSSSPFQRKSLFDLPITSFFIAALHTHTHDLYSELERVEGRRLKCFVLHLTDPPIPSPPTTQIPSSTRSSHLPVLPFRPSLTIGRQIRRETNLLSSVLSQSLSVSTPESSSLTSDITSSSSTSTASSSAVGAGPLEFED
jgi:hypothetical protein